MYPHVIDTSIFASLVIGQALKIPLTLGSSLLRSPPQALADVVLEERNGCTLSARAPVCRLWPGALPRAGLLQLVGAQATGQRPLLRLKCKLSALSRKMCPFMANGCHSGWHVNADIRLQVAGLSL